MWKFKQIIVFPLICTYLWLELQEATQRKQVIFAPQLEHMAIEVGSKINWFHPDRFLGMPANES